eukprot:tig00000057_g65.t1
MADDEEELKPKATGSAPDISEYELPKSVILRLIKDATDGDVNVAKDAKSAFARACSVFILYLTATANDIAKERGKNQLSADHVLAALDELNFPDLREQLKSFLDTFREEQSAKKKAAKERKQQEKAAAGGGEEKAAEAEGEGGEGGEEDGDGDAEAEHASGAEGGDADDS